MRLIGLAAVVMVAFAANSVLNRMAVAGGTDPLTFSALRVLTGAGALWLLVRYRGRDWTLLTQARALPVAALTVYSFGFSYAYLTLDAGVGALVLFGLTQITMFAAALLQGERPPATRWLGMSLALAGLAWLSWPQGGSAPAPLGVALMAAAGLGWGLYTLAGRGAKDPLGDTAANFVLAAPLVVLPMFATDPQVPWQGAILATISGVLTSGLGYALWYWVVPQLKVSVAALAQLTVPVIAAVGGLLFLGEVVSLRLVLASALVLGGVALGLTQR